MQHSVARAFASVIVASVCVRKLVTLKKLPALGVPELAYLIGTFLVAQRKELSGSFVFTLFYAFGSVKNTHRINLNGIGIGIDAIKVCFRKVGIRSIKSLAALKICFINAFKYGFICICPLVAGICAVKIAGLHFGIPCTQP